METKIVITARVETDSLDESAIWDCEAAVKETLDEWGYKAEVLARKEE